MSRHLPTRRSVVATGITLAASITAGSLGAAAEKSGSPTRIIPSTGEMIPAIGLGTWITFNVGNDQTLRDESAAVMAHFFVAGGRFVDSSPMYGSSQQVVGYALKKLSHPLGLFSADKIWTPYAENGPSQFEQSRSFWGVERFDLMQVHNLVAWQAHLSMLLEKKAAGELRYVGVTTSHGRRLELLEEIMRTQPLDFVQITYNVVDREVEQRILPMALDRGIAVVVNRPFRQGTLTQKLANFALPDWAAEVGASSWAQLILKFIISHPAVTVAIPATTRTDHVSENVLAAFGSIPNQAMRERISTHVRAL